MPRHWTLGRLGSACAGGLTALLVCAAPALASHAADLHADQIQVTHFAAVESGRLGISPAPISVKDVPRVQGGVNGVTIEGAAATQLFDSSGGDTGPETRCTITFGRAAHRSDVLLASAAAHEVFHCLSGRLAGTLATLDAHKAWLVEGAATWVESDLAAHDPFSQSEWIEYFNSPGRPLFSRDYDAIGFFGHLAASGISPWKRFAAMFAATSDNLAYSASGAVDPNVLDTEASEFFGAPELGDAWTADHQGDSIANSNVPPTHQVATTVAVAEGKSKTLTVKPYADGIYRLRATAPITVLQVNGIGQVRLRSTAGPEVDEQHITTLTLCRDGASCNCPGEELSNAKKFELGNLAIAGGVLGTSVTITGTCDLPPRLCTTLDLNSDFVPPGPEFAQPDVITPQPTSGSGPGLISGSGCTVKATVLPQYFDTSCTSPGCNEQPLGFYDILTFHTAEEAHDALGVVEQNVFSGTSTSPTSAGDEAFTSPVGGGMRVDNDVFFFRWFPKTPGEDSISPQSVLQSVASTLVSS
jgi:hypothetical protein